MSYLHKLYNLYLALLNISHLALSVPAMAKEQNKLVTINLETINHP